jgi:hypothetical protein
MTWVDWANVFFGASVAFSGWMVWRATQQIANMNQRLAWLSGALESHSEIMMRLTAQRDGIPVIYWDPDIEDTPTTPAKKHKAAAEVTTVYQYLPLHLRKSYKGGQR